MAESIDFRYGMLVKYHFQKFEGGSLHQSIKDYWGIGYVVKIADSYIKLSSLNPNKAKTRVAVEFCKKVKLENIAEFTEIPDTPPEDS